MHPLFSVLASVMVVTVASGPAPLAPGEPLPVLRGELLSGPEAELPALTRGRNALVAFGFTRGSSTDVEAWVRRFRSAYGSDTAFTWLEVPLISSRVVGLMKPLIQGGMRGGTPVPDRPHVLTAWGVPHAWKHWLAFDAPNSAYVVLLDREGRVRWRGSGPIDDARWRQLAAVIGAMR